MPTYTLKNALVDLGFIDGYLRENGGGITLFESTIEILDRIDNEVFVENAIGGDVYDPSFRRLLLDLGSIRGMAWKVPLDDAFSETMDRVTEFLVEGVVDWYQLPQPWRPRKKDDVEQLVTDQQRDTANIAYLGEHSESIAEELGVSVPTVERIVHPASKAEVERYKNVNQNSAVATVETTESPLISPPQATPSAPPIDLRASSWTPERRAAQAERAGNRPPLVADSELEAVKAEFDAGTPFDAIGPKFGCSGGHIRNFLSKHGIDPRRGRPGAKMVNQAQTTTEVAGTEVVQEDSQSDFCEVYVKPDVFQMLTVHTREPEPGEVLAPLH